MTATTKPVGALFAIDTARRDLQIAAEYKGMESANESALALITVRAAIAELIAAATAYHSAMDGVTPLIERVASGKRLEAILAAVQGENGGGEHG